VPVHRHVKIQILRFAINTVYMDASARKGWYGEQMDDAQLGPSAQTLLLVLLWIVHLSLTTAHTSMQLLMTEGVS
jgi:hypothetical protein